MSTLRNVLLNGYIIINVKGGDIKLDESHIYRSWLRKSIDIYGIMMYKTHKIKTYIGHHIYMICKKCGYCMCLADRTYNWYRRYHLVK